MAKTAKEKTRRATATKKTATRPKASKTVSKKKATAKPVVDRSADVEAYINKAAPFAQPILTCIRSAHRKASKQLVETIKWRVPHFECNGLVSGMAAFKQHVSFGFWKSELMADPAGLFTEERCASMCQVKIKSVDELPAEKVLIAYIKEAMALNDQDQVEAQSVTRAKKKKKAASRVQAVPPDLAAALKKPANKKARTTFENFPPSKKKEYVEWITDAKREETRARRLATTVEWLSEGKSKNWKYENC